MQQIYHYIGLDIHKKSISFCAELNDGTIVGQGVIKSTREAMRQWAEGYPAPWIGGMEATLFSGHVYDTLCEYSIELHVGEPAKLKAVSWAKHKGDAIDAETLANLLRANLFPSCHMGSALMRELRRVLRYRNFMVRQAVTMKNKTTGLLMEVGAPYDAKKIHRATYFHPYVDSLEEVPNSVKELLRFTRAGLEMFQSTQEQLIRALRRHDALRKRVDLLVSIPGVGEITALTWALEIDEPKRFSNVKQVQSYCGLCSGRHESAGTNKRAPLSKQRNGHLQSKLIEVAKLAPSWNPQLAQVHEHVLALGYNRNRATLAVARKLVAYLIAVDKSGKPFEFRNAVV